MIAALLDAIDRLGSATVEDLVAALGHDVVQVRHLIHEVLDQGLVRVLPERPDAYAVVRSLRPSPPP